ncbi:hypothetical protein EYF80_056394 [Liparis tanakae]|uniref:Uncharacterized protein n=1 Tax=Liparis tanakae TaxID=230148 RepID=A0A4Z2EX90_9TELE|nr:hypothetical protein EYF80_056394 [Liparis tanakae]
MEEVKPGSLPESGAESFIRSAALNTELLNGRQLVVRVLLNTLLLKQDFMRSSRHVRHGVAPPPPTVGPQTSGLWLLLPAPPSCSSVLLLLPAPPSCSSFLLLLPAPPSCSSFLLLLPAPPSCSSVLLLLTSHMQCHYAICRYMTQ